MAQHRGECRNLCRILACKEPREQDRDDTLECIEYQRQGGGRLVAGAQDIGGPDIARSDLAQVAQPHEPGQQHAEGDRPQQVADHCPKRQDGCGIIYQRHQAASYTQVPAT